MDEPVVVPIDGTLDLHTFNPKELNSLLREYIAACLEEGVYHMRIIHGKGKGVQKARVQSILRKHPLVESYGDTPAESGGWGATLVALKRPGGDKGENC